MSVGTRSDDASNGSAVDSMMEHGATSVAAGAVMARTSGSNADSSHGSTVRDASATIRLSRRVSGCITREMVEGLTPARAAIVPRSVRRLPAR